MILSAIGNLGMVLCFTFCVLSPLQKAERVNGVLGSAQRTSQPRIMNI